MSQALHEQDPFSVVANLAGPELLDQLAAGIASENPVDFALFSGAMRSTESTRYGDMVESVGEFRPGIDQPTQINIPATLAAERPQANRIRTDVDIPRLAIVADMPERLNYTSGRLSERLLGRYAVAMGLVLADRARSTASLVLANEAGAEEVFEDMASESYLAMEALDGNKLKSEVSEKSPLAQALEIAETDTLEQRDVALVVSDFLGGYDRQSSTFDWEDSLSRLSGSLDDRLLAVRLTSHSQNELPVVTTELPLDRAYAVREAFQQEAKQKANRLAAIFQNLRGLDVDADNLAVHLVVQINDFLVGTDEY